MDIKQLREEWDAVLESSAIDAELRPVRMRVELSWRQRACARNGHCFHSYADLTRAFEECCLCQARRNETVIGEQLGLFGKERNG